MKVVEKYHATTSRLVFLSDFSPPRGADISVLDWAQQLPVDFICVAYNPGRAVRMDSAMLAYTIKHRTGKDVIFNLSIRDMNKLGIQTHLLGAHLLGLENVVVLQGEEFSEKDRSRVKGVYDFTPTGLIEAINSMNQGIDFRGLKLRVPTDLCVGATIDLGKDIQKEARLAHKKVLAGAQFFSTQPIFNTQEQAQFLQAYREVAGENLALPVFYGLQLLQKDGVVFGNIPQAILRDLESGRPGTDIALELLHQFVAAGVRGIYLIPPIFKGGLRDYQAAIQLLSSFSG